MKKELILILCVFVGIFMLGFGSAWADNGSAYQEVDGCGTLSTAGATYVLTSNISSNPTCMIISADNIIFDGKGFWINYSIGGENGYGIYANLSKNLTIKDIKVVEGLRNSSSKNPVIYLNSVNNSRIENFMVFGQSALVHGVYFFNSQNNTLDNGNISVNGTTIFPGRGIYLLSGSNNNKFTNIRDTSDRRAIWLNSSNNLFENFTIQHPTSGGYSLDLSQNAINNSFTNFNFSGFNFLTMTSSKNISFKNLNAPGSIIAVLSTGVTISIEDSYLSSPTTAFSFSGTVPGIIYMKNTTFISSSWTLPIGYNKSEFINNTFVGTITLTSFNGTLRDSSLGSMTLNGGNMLNLSNLNFSGTPAFNGLNNSFLDNILGDGGSMSITNCHNTTISNSQKRFVLTSSKNNIFSNNTFIRDNLSPTLSSLYLLTNSDNNSFNDKFIFNGTIQHNFLIKLVNSSYNIISPDNLTIINNNHAQQTNLYPVPVIFLNNSRHNILSNIYATRSKIPIGFFNSSNNSLINTTLYSNSETTLFKEVSTNRIFNKTENVSFIFNISYLNESGLSDYNYSLEVFPNIPVNVSKEGSLLIINFSTIKEGVYSFRLKFNFVNNLVETRNFRFIYGDSKEVESKIYYFHEDVPTHNQPLPLTGYDSGSMLTYPTTSTEERHCGVWVQYHPDEILESFYFITNIKSGWYYISSGSPNISSENFQSFSSFGENYLPISNAVTRTFVEGNITNILYKFDYTSFFYNLALKLTSTGGNPSVQSDSNYQSYAQFTHQVAGADIIELKEHQGSDIRNMNLLSNIWNDEDKTSASLQFEGSGELDITLNISNLSMKEYSIYYDSTKCSSNPDCIINSDSDGVINLTLSLESLHQLDIYDETIIISVESPTGSDINGIVNLSITTNKNASCFYSLDSNSNISLQTTDKLHHSNTLNLENGNHNVRFYCLNSVNRSFSSNLIYFNVYVRGEGQSGGGEYLAEVKDIKLYSIQIKDLELVNRQSNFLEINTLDSEENRTDVSFLNLTGNIKLLEIKRISRGKYLAEIYINSKNNTEFITFNSDNNITKIKEFAVRNPTPLEIGKRNWEDLKESLSKINIVYYLYFVIILFNLLILFILFRSKKQ